MDTGIRMTRLREEYAAMYPPSITPGVWLPAVEVGARLLFWHLGLDGTVRLGDRLLPEEHFEFQGGWTRGGTSPLRTRAYDANAVEPRREATG
jgi:hypothetical protein